MESSKLWHILIVISSIRACIKFFEGTLPEDEYAKVRLFPNNFDYIGVNESIEDEMTRIRYYEIEKDQAQILKHYKVLEESFLNLFYQEIKSGIPLDVKNVSKDDKFLGDIKTTLESLTN